MSKESEKNEAKLEAIATVDAGTTTTVASNEGKYKATYIIADAASFIGNTIGGVVGFGMVLATEAFRGPTVK